MANLLRSISYHSYIHSSSFHSTSRSFGRSLHTSSRGGGSFGGHGYGGGGRGGGGGGATTDKVYFDKPYVEAEKTVDGGSATAAFNDLDSVSWAVEAITELKRIGVINGVSETEFAPNREVTREEFAKMIVNAFSITGEGKSFADVPATAWYAPFVTALRLFVMGRLLVIII